MKGNKKEPPLPIRLTCEHCGLSWRFLNEKCNAQKSIDQHYKGGDCIRQQQLRRGIPYHPNNFAQPIYLYPNGNTTIPEIMWR